MRLTIRIHKRYSRVQKSSHIFLFFSFFSCCFATFGGITCAEKKNNTQPNVYDRNRNETNRNKKINEEWSGKNSSQSSTSTLSQIKRWVRVKYLCCSVGCCGGGTCVFCVVFRNQIQRIWRYYHSVVTFCSIGWSLKLDSILFNVYCYRFCFCCCCCCCRFVSFFFFLFFVSFVCQFGAP